jgi:carbamoyltransferase
LENKNYYILGINGLGILPSACLLKNNEIVAMAEEERFTRYKGSTGMMPGNAVIYCLNEANISIDDLDTISFGWDANYYPLKMSMFLMKKALFQITNKNYKSSIIRTLNELVKYHPKQVEYKIKEMFREHGIVGKIPKIEFINHHLSHSLSTYYPSGFKKAHILVIDGSGEITSTSIWKANNGIIEKISSISIPNSLGWFYQSITEYLGFKPNNHEGKTMGLASYGKKNELISKKFDKIISFDKLGHYQYNSEFSFTGNLTNGNVYSQELEDLLGLARKKNEVITQFHKDIAYAAQSKLEDTIINLVENKILKDPCFNGNLCIAGGVSLNCKLNGKIALLNGIKNIYIPPFSSDNGTAFGAAISSAINKNLSKFSANVINDLNPYLGPSFSDEYIENKLKELNIKYFKEEDIVKKTTEFLMSNKIVGWFQGRMEVGSRALGNRSILANPMSLENKEILNKKVKNREFWRPFAVSILYEKREEYFDTDIDSPYMTIALTVKKEGLLKVPAGVHVDNTTRPQLVKKENNKKYYYLIKHFGDLTGTYALLNTSFNDKEEPIVCTPEQALRTFFATNLDVLVMGNFYILKSNKET